MSWSKSAKGTPQEVKDATAKWVDEQREVDRAYDRSLGQEMSNGHAKQAGAAASAISAVADTLADNARLEVSAWGHHNGDEKSDSGGLSLNYSVPTT